MAIATYKIPVLSAIRPNTRVGPPAYEAPSLIFVEGTNRDYGYFAFEPAKDQDILVRCPVPDNYSGGTRQIRLRWRSTVNTGNALWTIKHEPTASGQIWDEAFTGGPDTGLAAAPGTVPQITETLLSFTGTAWGGGDDLWVHIQRTGTDGTDTMAANAELVSIDLLIEVPGADHGGLVGLVDDDHAQYVLMSGNAARNDFTGTFRLNSAGFGMIDADGTGAGIDMTNGYFVVPVIALGVPATTGVMVLDSTTNRLKIHDSVTSRSLAVDLELGDGGAVSSSAANVTISTVFGSGSHLYLMDASGGAKDVALPDLATLVADRRCVLVQKADSSANTVTLTPNGTDTINGTNAAFELKSQHELIGVQANKSGTDWVITHFVNPGALVRSDEISTDLNNLGTNATPVALTTAYRIQGDLTNVRDYEKAVWYVYVAAIGTATSVTLRVEWYDDNGTYPSRQGAEEISAGASVLSEYEVTFTIGSSGSVPPLPLEVLGPNVRLSVKADIGTTTTVHSRIWRKA